MAKCEKCGAEYPEGTEHVCPLLPEEESSEATTSPKEETPS